MLTNRYELNTTKAESNMRLFSLLEAVRLILDADIQHYKRLNAAVERWCFDLEAEINKLNDESDDNAE